MTISLREVFNRQGTPGAIVSFRQLLETLPFGVNIGLRELHRYLSMAEFPENTVEVSREYIPTTRGEKPSQKIDEVSAALSAVIADSIQERNPFNNIPITANEPALKRNNARKLLRGFHLREQITDTLDNLDTAYTALGGHAFEGAETAIGLIPPDSLLPDITVSEIEEAFAGDNLGYIEIKMIAPGEPEIIQHTLKGYSGSVLDAQQLVAAHELATGGPERAFRLDLLKAEIHFRKQDFNEALRLYETLLTAAPLGSPRQKFLAIRAGFAHLGRGDSIFRESRSDRDDLSEAVKAYDAVIRVIREKAVSLENPLAKEIVDYANQQKSKIEGGFNYLGLTDGFVPIETVEFLEDRTSDHVATVKAAGSAFETYLAKAQQLEDVEAELKLELDTADKRLDIADLQIKNANDQIRDIDVALEDIADKQDFLTVDAVQFSYISLLEAAVSEKAEGVAGFTSRIIGFFAQANELNHQKKRAEIQRRIAERERTIGMLERDIVRLRRDFVQD